MCLVYRNIFFFSFSIFLHIIRALLFHDGHLFMRNEVGIFTKVALVGCQKIHNFYNIWMLFVVGAVVMCLSVCLSVCLLVIIVTFDPSSIFSSLHDNKHCQLDVGLIWR